MEIVGGSEKAVLPPGANAAVRDRLLAAARQLAQTRPLNRLSLSEISRAANVSWPTARRYLGSGENLWAFLKQENPGLSPAEPGTRRSILEAVARVFARKGYAGATLDEVGTEAGMTKGAVYWHFATKAELFLALVDFHAGRQMPGMPERIESALGGDDPREGLARILALHLSALKADPEMPRLYFEFVSESRDGAIRGRMAAGYRQAHAGMAEVVSGLRKQGRVSERVDPEAFAVLWAALLDGLCLLSLLDPERIDPERFAPQLIEVVWNGLKRRYGAT